MPKADVQSLSSNLTDLPDDERTAIQARDHALNERQSHRTPGKVGKGCRLDADWEHVDPNSTAGNDKIEIAAVQSALTREITAEIESVIAGLEADEIIFAERWNETLVVG
jgi:hypothetical protein